ncbi:hypothetical protein M0811_14065 [Anaeramoeba ignava]|uniref:Uncharacterized protein n=1 Tax=Anaeramoeba ignava TaxID=1746090 RepID=A0A9Q0LXB6_ANAIG|nr:hypothetical protein M0811_14065 [Anaeramoeba ignava]|eukprot:Anaeramoba_ignava/c18366_g2_i1.p1 GENE.c18366_g2_i1~~c18366_g2_i1.p1  ORF type:complete len:467 (-),score=147.68 c18366_g2_i1:1071-2471(-)
MEAKLDEIIERLKKLEDRVTALESKKGVEQKEEVAEIIEEELFEDGPQPVKVVPIEEQELEPTDPKLPKRLFKGSKLEVGEPLKPKVWESQGPGPLRLKYLKSEVQSDQYARSGKYNNYFISHLTVVNTINEPTSVTEIKAFWWDGKEWKAPLRTVLGVKYQDWRGFERYDWLDGTTSFNLKEKESVDVVVSCVVELQGEALGYEFRNFYSFSLPQPFRTKLVFEDTLGKKNRVVTEHVNPKLSLVTEKERKESQAGLTFFTYCDDTKSFSRIYSEVWRDKWNVCVRISASSSYYYWDKKGLEDIAEKAKTVGKTEYELENLKVIKQKEGIETHCYALCSFEGEKPVTYGFKFHLKTSTNETIDSCLIPRRPEGEESLTVTPTEIQVGQEVTVEWKVTEGNSQDWIGLYKSNETSNTSYLKFLNCDGNTTGKLTTTIDQEGIYVFKFLPYYEYIDVAVSPKVIVTN